MAIHNSVWGLTKILSTHFGVPKFCEQSLHKVELVYLNKLQYKVKYKNRIFFIIHLETRDYRRVYDVLDFQKQLNWGVGNVIWKTNTCENQLASNPE